MRKEVKILGVIAAVVIIAAIVGATYYRTPDTSKRKPETKPTVLTDAQLIRPDNAKLGPADAKVTLVEFFDPECEACRAFNPTVKQVMKDYNGKVRLVVRYMPLHQNSVLASMAIEAAGEQGKYWQMQELLFERQKEWGEQREPQNALFEKYAEEIGLNVSQFRVSMSNNKYAAKIDRDKTEGQSLGVRSTPTMFVNGKVLPGMDEQQFRQMIDEELKK